MHLFKAAFKQENPILLLEHAWEGGSWWVLLQKDKPKEQKGKCIVILPEQKL